MSNHEKERKLEVHTPKQGQIHNPIPTSLFLELLFRSINREL